MSYKTYESYKDSGVLWMERIPQDWNIKRLKFLCKNLDNERIPISADNRKEGPFPYYGAAGIVDYINDYIFDDKLVLIGEDGAPFFDKTKNVSFVTIGKIWVNNHAHVLKVYENLVSSEYLMHILNSTDYSLYITGSTRDKLNQDQLNNIPILIPSLESQEKITNYLDKKTSEIDENIAKNKELISLLEEKKTALINQVVTKGLNHNVPMKDSGIEWIGEIPEHWDVTKHKFLLDKITDGSHTSVEILNEGLPFVTVSDLDEEKEYVDVENCKRISKEDYDFLVRNGCKPSIGDILFSQIGTVGLVVPVEDNDDYVLLSSISILTPSKNVDKRWLIYFLKSLITKNQWKKSMAGGAVKRITLNHISNFFVITPPYSEQKKISMFLDEEISRLNKIIKKIQENIDLLEEYKTSLIHHAVTGKIDVRDEV